MNQRYYRVTLCTTAGKLSYEHIIVRGTSDAKVGRVFFRDVEARTYQVRVQAIHEEGVLGERRETQLPVMAFASAKALVEIRFFLTREPDQEDPQLISVEAKVHHY
jgi:hypothetical protein